MTPPFDPKSSVNTLIHDLPTPEPESPMRPRKPYRFSTLCATVENPTMKDQYGSSSVPIYQTSTFKGVGNEYDYSRSGNPTRSYLGTLLRSLRCNSLSRSDVQNTTLPKSPRLIMHSRFLPEWLLSML